MKNLKLTNLEKMQENEMQQIKGGCLPYISYAKTKSGDRCLCVGFCSGDAGGGRHQQGINDSGISSH